MKTAFASTILLALLLALPAAHAGYNTHGISTWNTGSCTDCGMRVCFNRAGTLVNATLSPLDVASTMYVRYDNQSLIGSYGVTARTSTLNIGVTTGQCVLINMYSPTNVAFGYQTASLAITGAGTPDVNWTNYDAYLPGFTTGSNFVYAVQGLWFSSGMPGPVATTGLNCTSCNPPYGSTTSPYITADTTPTFKFTTTISGEEMLATCRIGNQEVNYTAMGASRQCMGGENTTSHTCTLTSQDALPLESGTVYISCRNNYDGSESTRSSSGALAITGIATTTQDAIDYGIHQSGVWPQASVYQNQQVYLRDLSNNQKLATVDRVVAYGNQRWLINYHNGSSLGLFNITPVVYSLDLWSPDMTLLQIESAVTTFINATKQ